MARDLSLRLHTAGIFAISASTGGARSTTRLLALVAACVCVASSAARALPLSDAIGDTVAGAYQTYDISAIDAQFSATTLIFTITLTSAPVAPSTNQLQGLSGFIDIDVDLNPFSGATAAIDTLGSGFGSTGLGVEYYLDLFTEVSNPGFVSLKDPINLTNTQVPISYGASGFTIGVPLSALGNDDGLVHYAVVVGDFGFATDQALDPLVVIQGGLPATSVAAVVPEPATALLIAIGLVALGLRRG